MPDPDAKLLNSTRLNSLGELRRCRIAEALYKTTPGILGSEAGKAYRLPGRSELCLKDLDAAAAQNLRVWIIWKPVEEMIP
jgi:hypothetical protein